MTKFTLTVVIILVIILVRLLSFFESSLLARKSLMLNRKKFFEVEMLEDYHSQLYFDIIPRSKVSFSIICPSDWYVTYWSKNLFCVVLMYLLHQQYSWHIKNWVSSTSVHIQDWSYAHSQKWCDKYNKINTSRSHNILRTFLSLCVLITTALQTPYVQLIDIYADTSDNSKLFETGLDGKHMKFVPVFDDYIYSYSNFFNVPGAGVRIYDKQGTTLASADISPNRCFSSIIKGTVNVMAGISSEIIIHQITKSGSSYSMSLLYQGPIVSENYNSLDEPDTNYIYYTYSATLGPSKYLKYDYTRTTDLITSLIAYSNPVYALTPQFASSSYLVHRGSGTESPKLVDKTTLSVTKSFDPIKLDDIKWDYLYKIDQWLIVTGGSIADVNILDISSTRVKYNRSPYVIQKGYTVLGIDHLVNSAYAMTYTSSYTFILNKKSLKLVYIVWEGSGFYHYHNYGFIQIEDRKFYFMTAMPGALGDYASFRILNFGLIKWKTRDFINTDGLWTEWDPNAYFESQTDDNYWLEKPEFPISRGLNITTNTIVTCAEPNCLKWTDNYEIWTAWNTTIGYYLNDDHHCIFYNLIPATIGINLLDGSLHIWSEPYWTSCRNNYDVCLQWNTTASYYYNPNITPGAWVHLSNIPPSFGADLSTGTIKAWQLLNWVSCTSDYTSCTLWDTAQNYYLNSPTISCILKSSIPPGKGIDLLTKNLRDCFGLNWESCLEDYQIWQLWSLVPQKYYFDLEKQNTQNPWVLENDIGDGKGIVVGTNTLLKWANNFCKSWANNYEIWTECEVPWKLNLIENICAINGIEIEVTVTQADNLSLYERELLFLLVHSPKEATEVLSPDSQRNLVSAIMSSNKYMIRIAATQAENSANDNIDSSITTAVQYSQESYVTGEGNVLALLITIEGNMDQADYTISVFLNDTQSYTLESATSSRQEVYRVLSFSQSFEYKNGLNAEDLKDANFKGDIAGVLIGSSVENEYFGSFLFVVFSLEPSGVLIKMAQILKLYNRLYYVNVDYGSKLDSFLNTAGGSAKLDVVESKDSITANSGSYRGKLSKYYVSLDFIGAFKYKIIIYLASWVFGIFNYWVAQRFRVFKVYLYVMFFAPKLHLMLFNMFIMDFLFIGIRTILHSKNIMNRLYNIVAAYLWFTLMVLDIVIIIDKIFDHMAWKRAFQRREKTDIQLIVNKWDKASEITLKSVDHGKPEKGSGLKNKPRISISEKLSQKKITIKLNNNQSRLSKKWSAIKKTNRVNMSTINADSIFVPQTTKGADAIKKQIDYPRTYKEIYLNMHLLNFMSLNLSFKKQVFISFLCRIFCLMHFLRLAIYQISIVSMQYSPLLWLFFLVIFEIFRCSTSIMSYAKLKHFKFKIILAMEISQSLMLGTFAMFFLVSNFIEFKFSVDFYRGINYQNIIIYLIIASIAIEYILLFIFIILKIIDRIKNVIARRNALKKNIVLPKLAIGDFIQYMHTSSNLDEGSEHINKSAMGTPGNIDTPGVEYAKKMKLASFNHEKVTSQKTSKKGKQKKISLKKNVDFSLEWNNYEKNEKENQIQIFANDGRKKSLRFQIDRINEDQKSFVPIILSGAKKNNKSKFSTSYMDQGVEAKITAPLKLNKIDNNHLSINSNYAQIEDSDDNKDKLSNNSNNNSINKNIRNDPNRLKELIAKKNKKRPLIRNGDDEQNEMPYSSNSTKKIKVRNSCFVMPIKNNDYPPKISFKKSSKDNRKSLFWKSDWYNKGVAQANRKPSKFSNFLNDDQPAPVMPETKSLNSKNKESKNYHKNIGKGTKMMSASSEEECENFERK